MAVLRIGDMPAELTLDSIPNSPAKSSRQRTERELLEAAEAGLYKSSDGTTYARVQILSIEEILEGKQPEYPLHRRDATFKKAPRSRPAAAENLTLPLLPGDEV
jgi:hypothetical protein